MHSARLSADALRGGHRGAQARLRGEAVWHRSGGSQAVHGRGKEIRAIEADRDGWSAAALAKGIRRDRSQNTERRDWRYHRHLRQLDWRPRDPAKRARSELEGHDLAAPGMVFVRVALRRPDRRAAPA